MPLCLFKEMVTTLYHVMLELAVAKWSPEWQHGDIKVLTTSSSFPAIEIESHVENLRSQVFRLVAFLNVFVRCLHQRSHKSCGTLAIERLPGWELGLFLLQSKVLLWLSAYKCRSSKKHIPIDLSPFIGCAPLLQRYDLWRRISQWGSSKGCAARGGKIRFRLLVSRR